MSRPVDGFMLQAFRDIADAMQTAPTDWQWIGTHMSQRMFGITQVRAEEYARLYGGTAQVMPPTEDFDALVARRAAAKVAQ